MEAAAEAHQIKLRDLSGLIVVDFIDMMNFYNKECGKKMRNIRDRYKLEELILSEMTRQRLREGSIRWETQQGHFHKSF